jgi:hypothetical protein
MKPSLRLTRREALELLGMSAAAAAFPASAFAQSTSSSAFPKGAIIRTLLKDYAPEELATGATLFHEHMQLAGDLMPRFLAATAAVRAADGLPPAPARGGGAGRGPAAPAGPDIMRDVDLMSAEVKKAANEGNLACIVDGGHADMGRDINFLRRVSMTSGRADCRRRRVLQPALLPERDLDDERGSDRQGARQTGRRRDARRVRRDRIVGRDHGG